MNFNFDASSGKIYVMITRSIRVTLRFTPAEFDALQGSADADSLPLRTWLQRRLVEGKPDAEVLREIRKVNVMQARLWLATAQTQEAREEILRITAAVEAGG